MAQPGVIGDYLAALSRSCPPRSSKELADGLTETLQFYLRPGPGADEPPAQRWPNSASRTSSWPSTPARTPPGAPPGR